MTRRKVKLAFISNDSARKATYKKRKRGIIKKVRELTILCDVPACVIISNPFNSETVAWPDPEGAKQ
ncbi:agamous-like MADS-box protein AGL80-like, partial [Trifolium medium]|nr:agamous-like MADS-box protein AGL80-like [Trifolium medium]